MTQSAKQFLAEGKTTDIEDALPYTYHAEKQEREGWVERGREWKALTRHTEEVTRPSGESAGPSRE